MRDSILEETCCMSPKPHIFCPSKITAFPGRSIGAPCPRNSKTSFFHLMIL